MDNPETLTRLGTQETGRRQTERNVEIRGWTLVFAKGKQVLLLIKHHATHIVKTCFDTTIC